jgi:sigma-B regulation protein RsbU (phosphoserine phosphatase)
VLESARLAEEEAELQLLQQEMRMAAGIQKSLLPADTPGIAGYEIAGAYVPARLIGGDYFDYIPLARGRWGIVIADVSGKGIPAAMFMSVARTLMRVLARKDDGPGACLEALNDALCGETADAMFITILYGVLDPSAHSFTYASAGHEAPMLVRAVGGVDSLERPGGLLLGIFPDQKYREIAVTLAPGDALLLFTDGITEAVDDCGTQFGEKALSDLLEEARESTAAGIVQFVRSAVDSFACPEFKRDDVTMVAIRRGSAS